MKKCLSDNCKNNVFSHKYCKNHQSQRKDEKFLSKGNNKKVTRVPIKKVSRKRLSQLAEYSKLRKAFLDLPENKMCKVFPNLKSDQVHHAWGRENERLNDVRYWVAVSDAGHKYLGDHPEEAFEKGWCLYRNQKPKSLNGISKSLNEN